MLLFVISQDLGAPHCVRGILLCNDEGIQNVVADDGGSIQNLVADDDDDDIT